MKIRIKAGQMEEGSVDLENVGVTTIFNLLVTNYQHEFFPAGFILFHHQATYLPFPYTAFLPYHSVQFALSSNIPLRSGLLRTTTFTFLPPFNTASNGTKPKLFNFNLYHQYQSWNPEGTLFIASLSWKKSH